jgi:hypothetical protein
VREAGQEQRWNENPHGDFAGAAIPVFIRAIGVWGGLLTFPGLVGRCIRRGWTGIGQNGDVRAQL